MKLVFYERLNKTKPFKEWLFDQEKVLRLKVTAKLKLLEYENFQNVRNLKDGAFEKKFKDGTRIYFAEHKNTYIILLYGGNKDKQQRDIDKAKEYAKDFYNRYQDIENPKLEEF
ncbi:MAG: hypothetical protein LBN20_06025 [Endomicrobium sp.]|jgi:putative addiction module killer protein|nr:hypothetical protein [Endomicrobium sp.]